jgi:hypothetical protein
VSVEYVNTFTRINNLYLKRPKISQVESRYKKIQNNYDTVNAHSSLTATKAESFYGEDSNEVDTQALTKSIFDHIDEGTEAREGRYYIQGASERMIVHQFQEALLEFNKNVVSIL